MGEILLVMSKELSNYTSESLLPMGHMLSVRTILTILVFGFSENRLPLETSYFNSHL